MNALSRLPELVVIILVAVLVAGNIILLPAALSLGAFVLTLSCIFLFQTLIRDIWILLQTSTSEKSVRKPVFCVETTLGILGVIFGLIVYLSTENGILEFSTEEWTLAVFSTTSLCYLAKDLVISWRPFRIYRDPDHINIIVSLK